MRWIRKSWLLLLAAGFSVVLASCLVPRYGPQTPQGLLITSLTKLHDAVEPPTGAPPRTFHARLCFTQADGLSKDIEGREFDVLVQPPDRLQVSVWINNQLYRLGRNGQQLWIYADEKQFCLVGERGIRRFNSDPDSIDQTWLGPLDLPVSRWHTERLPRVLDVARLPDETIGGNECIVLAATRRPNDKLARNLPEGEIRFWLRRSDLLPQRIGFTNDSGTKVLVDVDTIGFEPTPPFKQWAFSPSEGDRTQTVALSHLTKFLSVRWSLLDSKIPTLGPATGERTVIATEGNGRLELIDGTRVLFVKGTPEEMGRQHGVLLKKQVRRNLEGVLYGMGVSSSLAKGTWFFGEMDDAKERLLPHMDRRYLREMDALALASDLSTEEVRAANMFPELFHCSGFAIYGNATRDGRLYHGRILDYFRGQGLEQNAVVIVSAPDVGHAWVNVSYAGFVGSVTAMNEKHVAIGEVGGRGEGLWDGKPMAQLVREVMEKADTVEEAVDIMRQGPRTCEYYYVISDGKTRRAVSIRATPTEFDAVWAGESHPMIPETVKDTCVVSGGDRFTRLIERIKAGYGEFDATSARDLMTRPICMKSNIHSVLFEPETLDFWVANANSKNVASATRYTHYNLTELLGKQPLPLGVAKN